MKYEETRFLILGMGVSGRSAASFLRARGAKSVIGIDKDSSDRGLSIPIYDEQWAVHWNEIDVVVISPGLPPTHKLLTEGVLQKKQILTEMELALEALPTEQKVLGITGSNGKTTVTMLVTHVLNYSHRRAIALGNIGQAMTSYQSEYPDETLVVELSSFQLERMSQPIFSAGVILNITPNHLDRHQTMEAYAAAKFQLVSCLKEGAPLYIHERAWHEFGHLVPKGIIRTFGTLPSSFLQIREGEFVIEGSCEVRLPPEYREKVCHNVQNMAAAYLLCREIGVQPEMFTRALETFKKPPHRVEFIRELAGIHFYDDSKGTNVEAVLSAIDSVGNSTLLIAGGMDKGTGYACWKKHFPGRVKVVLALGEAREAIRQELEAVVPVEIVATLQEAVQRAYVLATSGDVVLLSPGCASYDMFKNYEHRGEVFQALVHELC